MRKGLGKGHRHAMLVSPPELHCCQLELVLVGGCSCCLGGAAAGWGVQLLVGGCSCWLGGAAAGWGVQLLVQRSVHAGQLHKPYLELTACTAAAAQHYSSIASAVLHIVALHLAHHATITCSVYASLNLTYMHTCSVQVYTHISGHTCGPPNSDSSLTSAYRAPRTPPIVLGAYTLAFLHINPSNPSCVLQGRWR